MLWQVDLPQSSQEVKSSRSKRCKGIYVLQGGLQRRGAPVLRDRRSSGGLSCVQRQCCAGGLELKEGIEGSTETPPLSGSTFKLGFSLLIKFIFRSGQTLV